MDCSMPGFPVLHISWSLLKLTSIESVMPSNHLLVCHPLFFLPSVFPSIRVFSNKSALGIKWPSIGISASASVLPMNVQGWFPLGWTALISLQSKGLWRVCFRSTTQKHQFFGAQHSLLSISINIWVTVKFGVWFWLWAVVKFLWVKDNWWHLWANLWNVNLATEQTMEERKNRKEKGRELRVPGGGGQIGRWGRGWQVGEQGLSLGDSRPVQQAHEFRGSTMSAWPLEAAFPSRTSRGFLRGHAHIVIEPGLPACIVWLWHPEPQLSWHTLGIKNPTSGSLSRNFSPLAK